MIGASGSPPTPTWPAMSPGSKPRTSAAPATPPAPVIRHPSERAFRYAALARWAADGLVEIDRDTRVVRNDFETAGGSWVLGWLWVDDDDARAFDGDEPPAREASLIPAVQDLLDALHIMLPVLPAEWDRVAELVGWEAPDVLPAAALR